MYTHTDTHNHVLQIILLLDVLEQCQLSNYTTGFLSGGGGGGEHSPPPPPLRGPPVTYSYSITFDIVHDIVEIFPLLMAKAVLNESFYTIQFSYSAQEKTISPS